MSKRLAVAALVAVVLLSGCAAAADQPGSTGNPPPGSASASAESAGDHSTSAAARQVHQAGPTTPAPRVRPPVNHCAHNRADQLVLVSITDQHAWLCSGRHTAYSTAITTGMSGPYTRTPTGRYQIQGRNRDSVLTQSNGDTYDVKYWIPFDAPLYGFHDSSWQHFPYGSPKYRTNGSHGCVHMPLRAMRFLYDWVDIGASVTIRA